VRRVEITHGPNGWHPHLHVLMWTRGDVDLERDWFVERWEKCVVRELGKARRPGRSRGVDVRELVGSEGYVTKGQLEITDADNKRALVGHTSIAHLAARVAERGATARDLDLWLQYVQATKARRMLTWTNGLRASAGLGEGEDDAEADPEDTTTSAAASITREQWTEIRRDPVRVCEALEAAELRQWHRLASLGWTVHDDDEHDARSG
jgi:hypothetical protein